MRSVSKRTKKYANLPQLYPQALTSHTLDHRIEAARGAHYSCQRERPKRRRGGYLHDDAWRATNPEFEAPTNTKPAIDTDAGNTGREKKQESHVTILYVCVAVVVVHNHVPHTRLRLGE